VDKVILEKFIIKLQAKLNKKLVAENKKIKYKTKKDFQIDPVTKIDLDTEKLIRKEIVKLFPNHNIIGEEFKDKDQNSEYTWILDPIDGTKSMILGLYNWSNLIGLYHNKNCIMSFANFPILNKYYYAIGKESYVVSKKIKKKIKTNTRCVPSKAKVVINTLHSLRKQKIKRYIKSFKGFFKVTGVDALNFCMIAEGKIDVLIESGLKKVDILPIILILKNSGAKITDWSGNQKFKNGDVLVAPNSKTYNYFIKKIN